MWPYDLICAGLSVAAAAQVLFPESNLRTLVLPVAAMVLILFVGTRFQIGADWFAYQTYFDLARDLPFLKALSLSDPAYIAVGWGVAQMDGSMLAANLAYAALCVAGLLQFSRLSRQQLVFLCAAWPYVVMVVMMGYARQGVAIGLVMWAITLADQRRGKSFVGAVLLAALFHKSAVLMLPFGSFILFRRVGISVMVAMLILPLVVLSFVDSGIDKLQSQYIDVARASRGALIRTMMIAGFCAAFLAFVDREPHAFWRPYAFVGLVLPVAVLILPSSTVVDRAAGYFYPVALLGASGLKGLIRPIWAEQVSNLVLLLIFALQMQVWLVTTQYWAAWVPYQSFLVP